MRPALVPGGAVVFDDAGQVALGLSDAALRSLIGDAPDFMRMAVAHLAAERALETGLIETPAPTAREDEAGSGGWPWAGVDARACVEPSARVICAGGFLDEGLLSASLRAREERAAALPLVISGNRTYLGPLLDPVGSPCIRCLRRAVAPNRVSERLLPPEASVPRGSRMSDAGAWALFREGTACPTSEILEVDAGGRLLGRHHVRSYPDCPVCGAGSPDRNAAPPTLVPDPRCVATDTGVRVRDARATCDAYEHLISPLTGAVRRVRRVDVAGSDLIHVFTASHAMSEASRSFAAVMRDGRDHSGGKGSTADQARASALCEALERFSAVATGGEVDVVGRLDRVRGALDPRRCLLFSDVQYEERDGWNASAGRFQHVPEAFDPRQEIAWSRVWCLTTAEAAYLPTALLYFDFDGPGAACCPADSNGLAAGTTLAEAVLQAFLEVVERDAIAIWWYNRLRLPEVDVASFSDPYVADVLAHYASLGRRAWVLDLTSDLGIPVFAALSARDAEEKPEVIFGFGAHLDPAIALRRSVTEMSQMLATAVRPPEQRRAALRGTFDDALRWWEEATLDEHPYVLPDFQQERRGRACFHNLVSHDLSAGVDACLAIAARHGLRVYVRDMTRADLGIAVAKVVVPGLRHFWRRLAPGRLYEVPVATGRRTAPAAESELNPVSFFA